MPAIEPPSTEITIDIDNDWVVDPLAESFCGGFYIEPDWMWVARSQGTIIDANSSEIHPSTVSILRGDVVARQLDRTLRADEAHLFRDPATGEFVALEAFGNVDLHEPGIRYIGEQAWYQFEPQKITLGHGYFRFYESHARGQADETVFEEGEPVRLTRASYTSCAPGSNQWEVRASHLVLDEEDGRGHARHARLYIRDVPVLYTPYASFPIDDRRRTGFLLPSYSYSNRYGSSGSLPFYLNLAPHYDATIVPSYYQDNGARIESEVRYLSHSGRGDLGIDYMPYDEERDESRYAYHADYTHRFNKNWRSDVDFNRVSDDSYLNDFSSSVSAYSTQQLNQQAKVDYSGQHWTNRINVQAFQALQPDDGSGTVVEQYQRVPQLLSTVYYPYAWLGMDYNLRTEYVYFNSNESSRPTGQRIDALGEIVWPWERPWGYVKPTLELQHTQYYNNDVLDNQDETIFRTLPRVSLDSGLFFEREVDWLKASYLQTLEPRMYYLYVPFVDQDEIPVYDTSFRDLSFSQMFRSDRFNGADRVGDANQVTLAMTSRFLQSVTGRERARGSLGQVFFFENQEVTLGGDGENDDRASATIAEAYYAFSEAWSLRGYAEFDPNNPQIDKGTTALQYMPEWGSVVNLGYRYVANDPGVRELVNQSDISLMWPLFKRFRVLGRWNYDFDTSRSVDMYGGLEYETCCWAVRTLARRYIRSFVESGRIDDDFEYDTSYFVQFQLKGLMSMSSSATKLLQDTMPGFYDTF